MYLNRMLALLRRHHTCSNIIPDDGYYLDLLWFILFLKQFNGVVIFHKGNISKIVFVDATLTGIGGSWGNQSILHFHSALNLARSCNLTVGTI